MKRTFADEAKSIINKYSKREEDKWANKSKELELKLLMQKQEATGLTNQTQVKAYGGKNPNPGNDFIQYGSDGYPLTLINGKIPYLGPSQAYDDSLALHNFGNAEKQYYDKKYRAKYEKYSNPDDVPFSIINKYANDVDSLKKTMKDDPDYAENRLFELNNTYPDYVDSEHFLYKKPTDNSESIQSYNNKNAFPGAAIKANGGWIFDAMQFAPIAYNAIQGLTPEQKLKSGDYMVNDQVIPYDVSFAPQEQAMLSSTRALNKDILSTGNKSAGDIIRNLRGSQTQYRQGISGLANQEQMLKGQLKMSADQFNIGNKQQNAARRFTVDDWNARSKAAKQNMLGTATSQLAQYGQGKRSDMIGINLINSILDGEFTIDANGNLIRKKKKQSLDEEILNDNFTVDGK